MGDFNDRWLQHSLNARQVTNALKLSCTLYTEQRFASVWMCQTCSRKSSPKQLKPVTGEGCGDEISS